MCLTHTHRQHRKLSAFHHHFFSFWVCEFFRATSLLSVPLLDHIPNLPRVPTPPNISWSSLSLGSVHVWDRGCMLVGVGRNFWINSRCIISQPFSTCSAFLQHCSPLPLCLKISAVFLFLLSFTLNRQAGKSGLIPETSSLTGLAQGISYHVNWERGDSDGITEVDEISREVLFQTGINIHPDRLDHSPKWMWEFTQHTLTTLRHKNSNVSSH